MREGFYRIEAEAAGSDGQATHGQMLLCFQSGRFIGVDGGGCVLRGAYQADDGLMAIDLLYEIRAGSTLITGQSIDHDTRHAARFTVPEALFAGEREEIDIGFGRSALTAHFLAAPL